MYVCRFVYMSVVTLIMYVCRSVYVSAVVLIMYVCRFVYMSAMACGGQKMMLDLPELKLQLGLSHLMWVLGTKLRCSPRTRAVCARNC